jgi:hypothetical protein
MKVITGKAKVKDDSEYIYKGHTLEITGVYIEYKNGNGEGVFADGSREYKLSLIGTPFEGKHGTVTVIHDSDLDILELFQEIKLPLDADETLKLVSFAKKFDKSCNSKEILEAFLESAKGPVEAPEHDLTTLYNDVEWEKRNK